MKKIGFFKKSILFSFVILLVCSTVCALFLGCSKKNDKKKRAPKLEYTTAEYFDGTTLQKVRKPKDSFFDFELSDLVKDNHMSNFKGWNVGKSFYSYDADVFTFRISENSAVFPVFNLKFTQSAPQDLDYFASRLNMAKYNEFSSLSSPGFIYPALNANEGAVIQGATFVEKYNLVLLSAYLPHINSYGLSNSLIFVIDLNQCDANGFKGRHTKTIILHDTNGENFQGHSGGITATEKNIYVTGAHSLFRMPLDSVLAPSELVFAKFEQEIPLPVVSSFCFYDKNVLWVGEFAYEKENYKTSPSHKSEFNGEEYTGWTIGYKIDESNGENHVFQMSKNSKNPIAIPDYVFLHGNKIQGFATYGSKIVLSESFGRNNDSRWLVYDTENLSDSSSARTTVKIGGEERTAFYLSEPRILTAPPMSEDLCIIRENGKEYLLFVSESACNKYYNDPFLGRSKNPSSLTWKIDLSKLKD